MNTQIRDKFLTEEMGECYHDFIIDYSAVNPYQCSKCGFWHGIKLQNNFSTWKDFGKLWEWAKEQDWWNKIVLRKESELEENQFWNYIGVNLINPDKFADTLYEFLTNKKDVL